MCAIERTKDNYLQAQLLRLIRRIGKQKARGAVAHSVLTVIYYMLKGGRDYADLGGDYFDKMDRAQIERQHVRRLEQLGYTVTLTPQHAA